MVEPDPLAPIVISVPAPSIFAVVTLAFKKLNVVCVDVISPPLISTSPPTNKFCPRPIPPATTNAPVLVAVAFAVLLMLPVPVTLTLPPTYRFCPRPAPPLTIKAPVCVVVAFVTSSILADPPTYRFCPIPTPPPTIISPV